jgi:phospholipid/cholesterol/gamma-HCH transport system permease protein
MIPILTIFSDICGTVGGCEVAFYLANVARDTFYNSIRSGIELFDVTGGLLKAMIFGAEIALISCYQGLNARGGAAGVGQATTGSVVFSMILIFITNYFMTARLFPPA